MLWVEGVSPEPHWGAGLEIAVLHSKLPELVVLWPSALTPGSRAADVPARTWKTQGEPPELGRNYGDWGEDELCGHHPVILAVC